MSHFHQMFDEQKDKSTYDFSIRSDFLKHLTTLSTGSIVLITTLLNTFLKEGSINRFAIVIAIICFVFSIVAGAISYAIILFNQDLHLPNYHWSKKVNKILAIMILLGFTGGMIFVAVFAISNIYAVL